MKSPPTTQRIRPRTYRIALYSLITAVATQLIIVSTAPWIKNTFINLSSSTTLQSSDLSPNITKKNFSSSPAQAIDEQGAVRSEDNTITQPPQKIITIDPITMESTPMGIRWLIPIRTHIPRHEFNPNHLRIQFLLYEKKPKGKIQPAKGHTQIAFLHPFPSWSSGVETLEARYTASTQSPPIYGYILQIYYQEKLQVLTCQPHDICNPS
jgi:hypothetical protein